VADTELPLYDGEVPVSVPLTPAAAAFDAIAGAFDSRYGQWRSVAAQRRAVRRILLATFPAGANLLEIGGGTGEDALWMARRGRRVLMTDAAPRMVAEARRKFAETANASALVRSGEDLSTLAEERLAKGLPPFDGCYSNFAALNCISDLRPVARAVARMIRPAGQLVLVLFGPLPPGELVTQLARGEPRAAFRRLRRDPVPARIGNRRFTVRYHRSREVRDAFFPWFRETGRRGIGVFVPPSAAEPWISTCPRLLRLLEGIDRVGSRPLARLGDHVLHRFERTAVGMKEAGA
jgi:SAM-dependent methyltransferase